MPTASSHCPTARSAAWLWLPALAVAVLGAGRLCAGAEKGRAENRMRVITLNVAHGRGLSFQQMLLRQRAIRANLAAAAAVLRRERPHVVALQEVDAPSFWSGRFDHVAAMSADAALRHRFAGVHMDKGLGGVRLSYGTALLCERPLVRAESRPFASSVVTPRKGFVVAEVPFAAAPGGRVTVASVHLDFLRARARRRQARALVEALRARPRPLIVLGDLNCQWTSREGTLPALARELGVHAHEPTARNLATFPSKRPRRRLDWILVSPDLEFRSYRVLADPVSDHLAVVAELGPRRAEAAAGKEAAP